MVSYFIAFERGVKMRKLRIKLISSEKLSMAMAIGGVILTNIGICTLYFGATCLGAGKMDRAYEENYYCVDKKEAQDYFKKEIKDE